MMDDRDSLDYIRCQRCRFICNRVRDSKTGIKVVDFFSQDPLSIYNDNDFYNDNKGYNDEFLKKDPVVVQGCPQCGALLRG